MKTISCIRCDKDLSNVFDDIEGNQPDNGLEFVTHGHYGSTVFDPMDGTALAVNVCDDCLREAGKKKNVLTFRRSFEKPGYKPWSPRE